MTSVDGAIKYRGLSVEGEYYSRWLNNFAVTNTSGLGTIHDTGYQLQASAMPIQKILQVYFTASQVFGQHGNPSEYRVGESWFFMKKRGLRLNAEYIHVDKSPVGYTAYPLPVGARGSVFHVNWEINF